MSENSYHVEDESRKERLLEILSDKYARSILNEISYNAKSVMDISLDCQIPISTVYRRIQMLHDAQTIYVSGHITDQGKKLFLYKSKIKEIRAHYNDGQISVELAFNQHMD